MGGCGRISKEHVFSRAAFRQAPRSRIIVVGFVSIPDGPIGPDSPKAKVLCGHHNSLLSVLDSEVARITDPLLDFYQDRRDRLLTVSGFLFERWLYKVAINFMTARYGEIGWQPDEALVRLVFEGTRMIRPMGMHMLREWKIEVGSLPPEHMGVRPVYYGHSFADAELIGSVVTYHGTSFLVCMNSEFESLLQARPEAFPISPELLSYRPAAAVIYSKSFGTQFRLNFDWTNAS